MKLRLRISRVGGNHLGTYLPHRLVDELGLRAGDVAEIDSADVTIHEWSPEREKPANEGDSEE